MGSSGSGRFSDYYKRPTVNTENGQSGGSSGEDRCERAFTVELEDVAQHQFYNTNNIVPAKGTEVVIQLNKRLVAAIPNSLTIGSIPTSHNYIAACLKEGFQYKGVVLTSSNTPTPRIVVDFIAVKP